ncbi:hypothetical protein [Stieleria varia]|uniref:Uncharacterized protein n=1 Tax=Stieleria varia TaxID=2528005 RepID=A0A5C6AQW5_9BACT|nr:hypothetical protein [Stieleria varia]TWU02345.1 hypothetical protein Pla52n_33950 [Stieleria varia]
MHHKNACWIAACVAFLLCLDGCVIFRPTAMVRYETERDRFEVLCVMEQIRFEHDAEAAGMKSLWDQRENWLPLVLDTGFLGDLSFLRLSDRRIASMQLGASPGAEVDLPMDLSVIEIHPGEFFVNEDSGIAFHQSVGVPGKCIDAILDYLAVELSVEMNANAQRELLSDRPRKSWETVRSNMNDAFDKKSPATKNEDIQSAPDSRSPFRDESLQLLANGKLKYSRDGSTIQVSIPMSVTDQFEVIETFNHYVKLQENYLTNSHSLAAHVIRTARLSKAGGELQVEIKLDQQSDSPNFSQATSNTWIGPAPKGRPYLSQRECLSLLQKRGVPVRTDLTRQQVVSRWNEGR